MYLVLGPPEDILNWAIDVKVVLKNKPCETAESRFNLTEVLLAGDAKATWLDKKITSKTTTINDNQGVSKEVAVGQTK